MEFKDKIKTLRHDKGISQQALADAIFVSRSAVAKWENGLGFPSDDSMAALTAYFGVSASFFTADEPDVIIVEKNRKISRLTAVLTALFVTMLLLLISLVYLLLCGYRFTSLSAAGDYCSDWPCIRTAEYDFYLNDAAAPTSAQEVKKYGPLYKTVEGTVLHLTNSDGNKIGILSCFEGKDTNYYFIWTIGYVKEMGKTEDGKAYACVEYPYRSDHIYLNGEYIELELLCYFCTAEPFDSLEIKGETIAVTQPD